MTDTSQQKLDSLKKFPLILKLFSRFNSAQQALRAKSFGLLMLVNDLSDCNRQIQIVTEVAFRNLICL
jgi:hypothetical protein